MHHRRYLVADAHMGTVVVVEVDEARDEILRIPEGGELLLAVDTFHLYYTVGALCDGIVRRLVVLAHGDGNLVRLEHGHVCVAAVLHTTVGMVDQSLECLAARHRHSLVCGHLQCLDADGSLERLSQSPADYLVRVGIGDEMQVAHVAA